MIPTLIVSILCIALFYPLTSRIFSSMNMLFTLAVSYLSGLAVWTYIIFLANLKGLSFTLVNVVIVYMALYIFILLSSYFIQLLYKFPAKKKNEISYSKLLKYLSKNKIALSILICLLFFSFLINLYWPVKDWDSLVLYDFRAKLFVLHGGMQEAIDQGYFASYPLMTSISHTIIYLINPSASPMLLYFTFYLSFIIIFYSSLVKLGANQNLSLAGTLFMSIFGILFEQSTYSYTNLLYTLFLFTSYILALIWFQEEKNTYLLVAAFFAGFSGWIRFAEPFWIALVLTVLVMGFIKKKNIHAIVYLAVVYALRLPWQYFVKKILGTAPSVASNLSHSLPFVSDGFRISNIAAILEYVYLNVFQVYGIILLIYLLLLYYLYLNHRKQIKLFYLFDASMLVLIIFMIFIGTFLFSLYQTSYWQDIGDSLQRMALILAPLGIFASVRLFSILYKK